MLPEHADVCSDTSRPSNSSFLGDPRHGLEGEPLRPLEDAFQELPDRADGFVAPGRPAIGEQLRLLLESALRVDLEEERKTSSRIGPDGQRRIASRASASRSW